MPDIDAPSKSSQKTLASSASGGELRKVLVALLLGYLGFLGAFLSPNFSVPPLTLSILWGYSFPLIASMAYGARYGLIAGLFGLGAFYPFFLWPTNGWANVVTAVLILIWYVWQGYSARRRALERAWWNHPLVDQGLFALLYAAGTRYGYPLALSANPPFWAPGALTAVPVEVLDGLVAKGVLNLFLAVLIAMCALIVPEVRRLLRLPVSPHSRDNGKILAASVAAALMLWIILLLFNNIFIEQGSLTWVLSVDSPYEVISLVVLIATGLMAGYVIARYVELREKTDAARLASEARFRGTFEQVAVGISHASLEGQFIRVNQQLCSMLGYAREELLSLRYQDITHPDDGTHDRRLSDQLLRGVLKTFTLEKRYLRKDESYLWVNVTASLQRDSEGEPEYYIAVIEDISERRRAQLALRESEERLRLAMAAAAQGVYDLNVQTGEATVNTEYALMLGYDDPSELCETNEAWIARLHPEDRERVARTYQDYVSEKIPEYRVEFRQRTRSGGWKWILSVGRIVGWDSEGRPLRMLGTHSDITEQKQLEQALRESQTFLSRSQEIAHVGSWVLELSTQRLTWSDEVYRILGMASRECAPTYETFLSLVHPEDRERVDKAYLTSIQQDRDSYEIEHRVIRRHTGEVRHVHEKCIHERGPGGEIIRSFGMVQDITKHKRDEQALRESHRRLEKALAELQETQQRMVRQERLAAVGQLAAGVAHDFNNILAVMVLYTQIALQVPALPESVRGRLNVVLEQADRAAELIQQIVDFSRRTMLERHFLDLLPFLKEQMRLLERTLPENIHLELEAEASEYVVNADPTRIQQTLFNLAFNARDAMPRGGRLCFGLEHLLVGAPEDAPLPDLKPGAWIKLTVTDTGTGIAPNVLPHLFEPFFTTKAPGKGTGLGLAQVHGIIKQHEGEIEVHTALGQGTTFALYLPAVALSQPEEMAVPTSLKFGQGEGVLIVEDDAALRTALAGALELMNYRVFDAPDGRTALSLLEQWGEEIALVMSDFIMPELGGRALLEALYRHGLTQPVVMLSGYPLQSDLAELEALGLTYWLPKPPEMEELARVLAEALAGRKARDKTGPPG